MTDVTVHEALELAVKTEQVGATFYTRLAERFGDEPELAEMFNLLARDERLHEQEIRSMLSGLGESRAIPDDRSEYLRAVAASDIVHGAEDPAAVADRVSDRDDALQIAHDLEKASLLYYTEMKSLLGGQGAGLDAIIDMEKQHLRKVFHYMITGAKMRGLSDPFEAT